MTSTHPRSRVNDVQNAWVRVCFSDFLKHLFVFHASRTETTQRLWTSRDRRLVGMEISEGGQATLRSKPWASQQNCLVRGIRHKQQVRVSVAKRIFSIHCRQLPLVVRHFHSPIFVLQLEEVPAGRFHKFLAAWRVLEAVEALNVHWTNKRKEGREKVRTTTCKEVSTYLWRKKAKLCEELTGRP